MTIDPASVKDLLPILFERETAVSALWNIDIPVTFAIFAFLTSDRRPGFATESRFRIPLVVAYAFFAISNLQAMLSTTRQRAAIRSAIDFALKQLSGGSAADQFSDLNSNCKGDTDWTQYFLLPKEYCPLHVPSYGGVFTYHIIFDLVALVGIWYMTAPRHPS